MSNSRDVSDLITEISCVLVYRLSRGITNGHWRTQESKAADAQTNLIRIPPRATAVESLTAGPLGHLMAVSTEVSPL